MIRTAVDGALSFFKSFAQKDLDSSRANAKDFSHLLGSLILDHQATREESAVHENAHQLAAAVELDMGDWWQPTAGSYLANVPKARRMEAVREAVNQEPAASIATMKKEAMVSVAEQHLEGRRWLPAVLRRPAAAKEVLQ
ncbi:hypothetical protein [Cupriavidus sp. 8B]